jgi:DNA polymerase III alpha subunit
MSLSDTDLIAAALLGRQPDFIVSQLCEQDKKEFLQSNVALGHPLDTEFYEKFEWMIPDEYKSLDLRYWLLQKCDTEQEVNRVELEWSMYDAKGLVPLLQAVKYLVDVMNRNQVLWGIGRGSSVASYILYLLGVHRINSIKWDLDPKEFFR